MKRLLIFIAVLLAALMLCGCSAGNIITPEAASTDAASPAPSEEANAESCGSINADGWMKVVVEGAAYLPFEYFVCSRSPVGNEVFDAGYDINEILPHIADGIPAIRRAESLFLSVYEWGSICEINVFSSDLELAASLVSVGELYEFIASHPEELIVDVHIGVSGCMIFEEDARENVSGYVFRLLSAEAAAKANAESVPYLRLYSYGAEQETYEYFCYASTAVFEEGRPKGFLAADGEMFFIPITEKAEELPVIEGYCRVEGLDVRLIDGAEIKQIKAYRYKTPNGGLEPEYFNDLMEFNEVFAESEGLWVIDITVVLEGRYYQELGGCESYAMGYAFVISDGPSPFPTICPGEGGE